MLADSPAWIDRLNELHLLTPIRVLLIVLTAMAVSLVIRRLISRVVKRTVELPGLDPYRSRARQRALGSTLRSGLVGIVWATAVISIISEVGINIGAFVATATVVGGAIAFGAQTLIRDAIAGFFVLAEDQYGVGDEVDLGHAAGIVERITLRSARLRDAQGRIWHVPHGNVMRASNLSKSSRAMLELEVSRDSKMVDLKRIAGQLGEELKQDPEAGPLLTDEPKIIGLTDIRDDRLVIRVIVSTLPGKHDEVRRVWRTLALEAFQRGELVSPPAPTTVVHLATTPAVLD